MDRYGNAGMDLRHAIVGDGMAQDILFLHGFMGRRQDWDPVVCELGHGYRSILPDLPGHGETPWPYLETSWRAVGEAVLTLLDQAAMDRCWLVGYSMGGRLGLYLALTWPERFHGAVLESASPGLATEDERRARREHDQRLAADIERRPMAETVRAWYGQPLFATMHRHPERLEALIAGREANDPQCLAQSLRVMGTGVQPSLWERLPACSIPLLFLAGECDTKYAELARAMTGICPGAQYRIVPECGHNVHWENPAEYTRCVKGFIGGL